MVEVVKTRDMNRSRLRSTNFLPF